MTDDTIPANDNPGCFALLVSVTLAALLLAILAFPADFPVPLLFIPVFGITALVAALVGLPLYLLVRYLECANVWTALAAGALTGAIVPLMGGAERNWQFAAMYAAVGAIGGLAFFLTATAPRAPRRNTLLLVGLATLSIAATFRVAEHLHTMPRG